MIICSGDNIYLLDVENVLFINLLASKASVINLVDIIYAVYNRIYSLHRNIGRMRRTESRGKTDGSVTTKQELKDYVQAKLLGYLVPKYVFYTRSYPKTLLGKSRGYIRRE